LTTLFWIYSLATWRLRSKMVEI